MSTLLYICNPVREWLIWQSDYIRGKLHTEFKPVCDFAHLFRCFTFHKQECIPVGCEPAVRWPYAGVCFREGCLLWGGGVCSEEDVWSGGCLVRGCLVQGGVWSRGYLLPGGLVLGGVSAPGAISQHALRQTPPVDRHTPVKILPWPNFVAAGH